MSLSDNAVQFTKENLVLLVTNIFSDIFSPEKHGCTVCKKINFNSVSVRKRFGLKLRNSTKFSIPGEKKFFDCLETVLHVL